MTAGSAGAGVDRRTRLVVPQQQRLPGNAAEVDDHVGPLGRAEQDHRPDALDVEVVDSHRCRQEAALGADLPDVRRRVLELQGEEA
jgi:hypothetical protein